MSPAMKGTANNTIVHFLLSSLVSCIQYSVLGTWFLVIVTGYLVLKRVRVMMRVSSAMKGTSSNTIVHFLQSDNQTNRQTNKK